MANKPPSSKKKPYNSYARYSGMGFQMLAVILLGVWGGIKLDERLSTDPLFTVILSLFGVFMAMYLVFQELRSGN